MESGDKQIIVVLKLATCTISLIPGEREVKHDGAPDIAVARLQGNKRDFRDEGGRGRPMQHVERLHGGLQARHPGG